VPFFGPGLAYQEVGQGRPLVLLHGFGGDGSLWRPFPGFRVILPDFRGHGSSAQPLDKEFYPPDVLADDGLALIEHLGLDDYDLGGYSLGARIVVRMLVRGARPRRAIVGGQGLREVQGIGGGAGAAFRKRVAEPNALAHVLASLVATPADTRGDRRRRRAGGLGAAAGRRPSARHLRRDPGQPRHGRHGPRPHPDDADVVELIEAAVTARPARWSPASGPRTRDGRRRSGRPVQVAT
jgi:pimeloyl-ACP methyl ester carboxylesterase